MGKKIVCLYCGKSFAGGGINRVKQHLAGIKGDVDSCRRVPPDVRFKIKENLDNFAAKKRRTQEVLDACIPFNAVNSVYYQQSIDAIASMGPGYKGPNFHTLRGYLLAKNVEEVQNYVESYRSTWKTTGCTIMADGWTDRCKRTLINFLVYCPKGTIFLKSVDASDESKSADMLYKLFRDVVLFVGAESVVHIVTDNAANYVAAGRLLEREFQTLFWSPCAAHCINLMFHDIGKLEEVSIVVYKASQITKYIYNHCYPLHLMRKFTGGKEILRPGATHFATNFIALQSILAQKDPLREMVTSREWTVSAYAKDTKGKRFVDDVLDSVFWKECSTIVQLTEPLVRVLRIVDSDEKPSMGYLYEAIHVAKSEMERRFQRRKNRIAPYLQIIQSRWDRQLRKNLHAAGYWLNPCFQYNNPDMDNHKQTISGLLDVIERYAYGQPDLITKLTSEMRLFRQAHGDFGHVSAVADRRKMVPDEWWMCYGSSAPNLQTLAIRVLSQTCSSSGCERNWSMFEHIHSKKRNRLEHQRLNDLVYVHYNLRLQQRNYFKTRNYDPIDFERFGTYDNWVLEEEPPNLVDEELETFRRDLGACSIQNDKNDDELHFVDLDLDCDENDGNGNDNRSDTNNGIADFSMIETPSFVQGEGIEEFMSETPAWMRSNSS